MALQFPAIFFPLLLLLPLFFIFRNKLKSENKHHNIPPSPPKLPILGNLHQLSELLHQSYSQLSKKYGPVMLLHLGQLPSVVICSAEAAREALKVHDLATCSRPLLAGSGRLSYNYLDVAFAPYGELWRKMRQLIVLELFSMKRVNSFRPLRESEVGLLRNSISESSESSSSVNLTDMLFALTANITFKMSFGFDYRGTDFDRERFHEVVHDGEAVAGSFSTGEFFPFYGWIIDRITGHHARTERVFHELDKFFQYVIDDHQKPGRKKDQDDMIDVLLKIEKEQALLAGEGGPHFTKDNIKGVLLNLFLGGIDTSAITINWAMAELVKNPRVMKKLQDEVRNCIGNNGRVTEADIDKLKYLKMVVKETFRLHPAAPLLLPRETLSHIKINGFDIYPKTMIQVNAWAIGRDPKYWKNAEEFFPERFDDSSVDFKGKHFEFLPFGAGRRMCVGMNLGTITAEFVLASLVYSFDWKLPDGMEIEDINMEEQAGVSLTVSKKTPLCLVPVKYMP